MDAKYYRVNSVRLTTRQYWDYKGLSFGLLHFLLLKFLHIKIPNLYWTDPSLIQVIGAVPGDSVLAPLVARGVAEIEAEGFHFSFYSRTPQLAQTEVYGAVLISEDRQALALYAASQAKVAAATATGSGVVCLSRPMDGRDISTSNLKGVVPTPPHVDAVRLRQGTARDIIETHRKRISGQRLRPFGATPEAILEDIRQTARRTVAFLLEQGILAPMTAVKEP